MIDLHCHVLPGIDDGPDTMEGTVALVRAAAAAGVDTLVATPHVSWHYPNDADTIAGLVCEVNARLVAEEIALEIRTGAEIAMTRVGDIEPAELTRFGLGGGNWLLVEPPFTAVATGLDAIVLDLHESGHRVVIAHPERCRAFQRDPGIVESLVRGGVLTSVTAGSLVGHFGREVQRFALELVRAGMVHNVASDAHDHLNRPPGIAEELDQAGLGSLANWLTEEVPAAILSGAAIPPQPAHAVAGLQTPRRSWWRRAALRRAS